LLAGLASVAREVQRLARPGFAAVGGDAAVGKEPEPAVDPAVQGQVPFEKVAGAAIADGDAESVAEVVLGVPRQEDAMAAPLGAAVRALGLLTRESCGVRSLLHRRPPASAEHAAVAGGRPNFRGATGRDRLLLPCGTRVPL